MNSIEYILFHLSLSDVTKRPGPPNYSDCKRPTDRGSVWTVDSGKISISELCKKNLKGTMQTTVTKLHYVITTLLT